MTTASNPLEHTDIRKEGETRIVSVREFAAARELVFDLYTDPALVPEWWGPRSHHTVVDEAARAVGDRWRYVSTDADGVEHAFHGVIVELDPPNRLVQTFQYEGVPADGTEVVDTAVFKSIDDGSATRLTITSTFSRVEARDGMWSAGMARGLNESHDRFAELLTRHH